MKRNKSIDIMKGIGVLLMVLGHLGSVCPDYLHSWIYSFHMPLFFFCSGFFARECRSRYDVAHTIKRRCRSLFIPYLVYAVVFMTIDCILEYHPFNWNSVIAILLGNDQFGFLWFIYVLFFIAIVFSLVSYYLAKGKTFVYVIVSVGLSCLGFAFHEIGIVERLGSICYSFGYFVLGKYSRMVLTKNSEKIQKIKALLISIVISLGGTFFLTQISGNRRVSIDIHHNYYPDILFTYIIALAGICSILILSQYLCKYKHISNILSYIGKESLIIYPIFTYLPLRVEFLFRMDGSAIKLATKLMAIFACVLVVVCKNYLHTVKCNKSK